MAMVSYTRSGKNIERRRRATIIRRYSPYLELHDPYPCDGQRILVCTLCQSTHVIHSMSLNATAGLIMAEVSGVIKRHWTGKGETPANSAHWFREQVVRARANANTTERGATP